MTISEKVADLRAIIQLVIEVIPSCVSIIKEILLALKELKTV